MSWAGKSMPRPGRMLRLSFPRLSIQTWPASSVKIFPFWFLFSWGRLLSWMPFRPVLKTSWPRNLIPFAASTMPLKPCPWASARPRGWRIWPGIWAFRLRKSWLSGMATMTWKCWNLLACPSPWAMPTMRSRKWLTL